MNTPDFANRLSDNLRDVPEIAKVDKLNLKQRIENQLEKMKAAGAYSELEEDEQKLLAAYNYWKHTADAANGVFHYKRS